ncbi:MULTISPECIES: deoxyribose-phosphate aldolase [unclassified Wenzhouxiangella]|uniref:deoxyribose-phosphate aldolase n=1 Tax=unclassified Wenzhouxiangella TaxID=2613841 RepID=UPI000E3266DD|nr:MULTISPECIES: deoxyribose-phosphate aldolase [unclassified Wenzhouxiangella]RFF26864.1 deoxyribose-phosphate aldolase [Wenzhouxiangella sp. 15181]RFP68482.1 deoxyribose-phosphate aldolase [Wenzhouxiangella sp. 15190]
MTEAATIAQLALRLMDLTRLEADDDESAVRSLCRRAGTPFGPVAAVCVYPRFIHVAQDVLSEEKLAGRVRVATVVNFPGGSERPDRVIAEIREALEAGADEIDLVFPWRSLREGDAEAGRKLVMAARKACGEHLLKVILETGELADAQLIRKAAEIAVEAGADFLKTSTGKVPVNATPEAARILLETIHDSGAEVGCKVSGGIRTAGQAREYLEIAAGIMGKNWITPEHFRFGASGLLDDLLATLED